MASDDFARECREVSRNLRRVPSDLRRAISSEVRDEIAVPLAGKIKTAATGPWSRVLSAGTKARAGADPTIVVGGASPKLSGGAGPRQVIFGAEFGGGKRLTPVPGRSGRRGYRRYSTNQFRQNQRPFVFSTVSRNYSWALEKFADIVLEKVDEGMKRGG